MIPIVEESHFTDLNHTSVLLRASQIGSGRISPINNHYTVRCGAVACFRLFVRTGSVRHRHPDISTVRFGYLIRRLKKRFEPNRSDGSNRTVASNRKQPQKSDYRCQGIEGKMRSMRHNTLYQHSVLCTVPISKVGHHFDAPI